MLATNTPISLFKQTFITISTWISFSLVLSVPTTLLAASPLSPNVRPPQSIKPVAKAQPRPPASAPRNPMQALAPQGIYVVVDTAQNKVYVREGEKILHTAVASTGSGASLQDPRNPNKGWVFETPRGVYAILNKIKNPAWVKPDWAFIEEGESIPTKSQDRVETGVLGDYALGFGNGYFIHGTLYTRLLGTNVTHGCIRLGDKDLEYLYRHVPTGATLIIF